MKQLVKYFQISVVLIFVLGVFVVNPSRINAQDKSLEIILDVSGSMRGLVDGEQKIDIAKKAISSVVNKLPSNTKVGFRAYGHQYNKSEKNCTDTELIFPISVVNKEDLIAKVNKLTPNGWTPIEYSLRQARDDFKENLKNEKSIVLVSDGEESCGGDPCLAMKQMKKEGFDVVINTVGFDVDDTAEKQLKCIASATEGEYKSVKSADELISGLSSFVIDKKEMAVDGVEIRGGDDYSDAVLIESGVEYKLDHHQKVREQDVFYMDLKKGQAITASIRTARKNITIHDDGSVSDNKWGASHRMEIHDFNKNKIATLRIIMSKSKLKKISIKEILESGRYYFLIGDSLRDMHKDSSMFKIEIEESGNQDEVLDDKKPVNMPKDVNDTKDISGKTNTVSIKDNEVNSSEDKDSGWVVGIISFILGAGLGFLIGNKRKIDINNN